MGWHDTGVLPRDVVRDLLGVARSLYATRKAAGASVEELAKLEYAGNELVLALKLSKTEPDTNGHRAAWSKADRGTAALIEVLVQCDESLVKLVSAWADRLRSHG